MARIREYFDKDFAYDIASSRLVEAQSPSGEKTQIMVRIHFDFDSHVRYLSVLLPVAEKWLEICKGLVSQWGTLLIAKGDIHVRLPLSDVVFGGYSVENADTVRISAQPLCEPAIQDVELPFSGRVFVYSENDATESQISALKDYANGHGVRLRWRGPQFAHERSLKEKPLAFISYDTRDREEIARPIALRLQKLLCPVWYDEFSLGLGASLRRQIEDGLKECAKCILILSPNFFSNRRWTRVEFDSVFTREILEEKNVMLPVWCGVSVEDVFKYSPSLADKVGLKWESGVEEVCRRLHRVISDITGTPPDLNKISK